MRLTYPAIRSLRIQNRSKFRSLSEVLGGSGLPVGTLSINNGADLSGGGYIVFSGMGADSVWAMDVWTIDVDVLVPAIGSQRAVVTCGHSTIGSAFELGVAASGKMYATGTATIESDSVVTAGRHSLRWVYTGTAIEFWYDGSRLSLSAFTPNNVSPPALLMGVAADAVSRKLGSTIYSIDVYQDALDFWTPASEPSLLTWLEAVDVPATLVPATQPNNSNSDFSAWTGAYPDADPTGWTKAPDPGTAANHVEDATNACRLVSDGTYVSLYKAGITGNRYTLTVDVSSIVGGLASIGDDFVQITTTGSITRKYTAAAAVLGFKRYFGATDVTFTHAVFTNLTRTRWNPKAGSAGGYFSSALATTQPWFDGSGVRGLLDVLTGSQAVSVWSALHQSGGCTVSCKVNIDATATGNNIICDTANFSVANAGITFGVDVTNRRAFLYVMNASGGVLLYAPSAVASITLGTYASVTIGWSPTYGYKALVDGQAAVTGAVGGVPSVANAANTLNVLARPGGSNMAGAIKNLVVMTGTASVDTLHAWQRAQP